MISWFTESALVPMVCGTFIALAFLGLAISFRDKVMLLIAIAALLITAGTGITEMLIVTDREAITEIVQELAFAVENNDMDDVLKHVSDKRENQKTRIRSEMPNYKFRTCRVVGTRDFSSSHDGTPASAMIDFVVLATGSSHEGQGTVQRRVILHFEKEPDGKWRMVDYEHSDPRSDVRL